MRQRHTPSQLGFALTALLFLAAPTFAQQAVDKGPGSGSSQPQEQPKPPTPEEQAQQEAEQKRKIEEIQNRNKAIEANNRGFDLQKGGKNAEALKAFQEALLIDPNYELAKQNLAIAHYNLATEAAKSERWALAIENFEAARTHDKGMRERTTVPLAGSYNNQAAVLVEANRLDDAVASMEKAAELDSKYDPELTKLKAYRDQVAAQKKPGKPR